MERLTDKKEADVQRRKYEIRLKQGYPRNIPEERFLRLAAYEDTGLEPEDFKKAFNEDSLLKLTGQLLGVTPDRLRELAQADKEGQCFIGPFVAMIEQSLSGGEMKPQRDQRFNGRYAVVYFDPKKWSSPLIDICGTPYNREEAKEQQGPP